MADHFLKRSAGWDKLFIRAGETVPVIVRRRTPTRCRGERILFENFSRATLSQGELLRLTRDENVLSVTPERVFSLQDGASDPPNLFPYIEKNIERSPGPPAFSTGRGITCAFLETGLYPHPHFRNRLRDFFDLVEGRQTPYDDHGHGTHVAGIFCGEPDTARGFCPVAPDAGLVMVKVLDRRGLAPESRVIEALGRLYRSRNSLGLDLLSLSLGSEAIYPLTLDPLILILHKFHAAGIPVFAASGNGGKDAVTSPAAAPFVIAVGACYEKENRLLAAPFTGTGLTPGGGRKPDIWAPGVEVLSLTVPWHPRAQKGLFLAKSGTSMACPAAAGMAARLLEKEPALGPEALRAKLLEAAVPLDDSGLPAILPGPEEEG